MSNKNTEISVFRKHSSRLVLLSWFIVVAVCFVAQGAEKAPSLMNQTQLPSYRAKANREKTNAAGQAETEDGEPKTGGVVLWLSESTSDESYRNSRIYGSGTDNQQSSSKFRSLSRSGGLGSQSSFSDLRQGLGLNPISGNAKSRIGGLRQLGNLKRSGLGGFRMLTNPKSGLKGARTFPDPRKGLGGAKRFNDPRQGLRGRQSLSLARSNTLGSLRNFGNLRGGLGTKPMFNNLKGGLKGNSSEPGPSASPSSSRILNY